VGDSRCFYWTWWIIRYAPSYAFWGGFSFFNRPGVDCLLPSPPPSVFRYDFAAPPVPQHCSEPGVAADSSSARDRRQRIPEHFSRRPSSGGSSCGHRWRPLSVPLRHPSTPSYSRLPKCFSERSMRTHKMIVCSPPLKLRQQVWGLLGGGPRATGERCYPMPDRQIYSLNERGVQPT
jgi:hypothetical protein